MISDVFRCPFCRRRLRPVPSGFLGLILAVLGVRRRYCPHCFTKYWRPGGLLYLFLLPPMYLEVGWKRLTGSLRRPTPAGSGSASHLPPASSVTSAAGRPVSPGDGSSVAGAR